MFLTDFEIATAYPALIQPFCKSSMGKPSRGLSSCGYDLSLGNKFKFYKSGNAIDCIYPPEEEDYFEIYMQDTEKLTLDPGEFVLACTQEYIKMPNNLTAFIMDKSSLARLGLFAHNTIIEPGWEGHITLELVNNNRVPILLAPNMGICQIVFAKLTGFPINNYKQRSGKYQGQTGVTIAK